MSRQQIARWRDTIRRVRADEDISEKQISDAEILAFVEIESWGDEYAHRQGSQFYGLLQMGKLAGQDVNIDQRTLLGHGDAAIRYFLRYQRRYEARHQWDPYLLAVNWKGGCGTCLTVQKNIRNELPLWEAIEQAEDHHNVPNVVKYVRKWEDAWHHWEAWCDDHPPDDLPEPEEVS